MPLGTRPIHLFVMRTISFKVLNGLVILGHNLTLTPLFLGRIVDVPDSLAEGSEFELPVPLVSAKPQGFFSQLEIARLRNGAL